MQLEEVSVCHCYCQCHRGKESECHTQISYCTMILYRILSSDVIS